MAGGGLLGGEDVLSGQFGGRLVGGRGGLDLSEDLLL